MRLQPVNWLHVRVGALYCAKDKGEVKTVKLVAINQNGHAYTVETMGREEPQQFKTSTLYYVATIGR